MEPSKEPVAVWTAVALIIVTLAAQFHVVIELSVVENIVLAIPVVISAIIARANVTPVPPGARGIAKR